MKKTLSLLMILVLLSITTLSSCIGLQLTEKIETAEEALMKISETMESVSSFRGETTLDIVGNVDLKSFHLEATAITVAQLSNDGFTYYYDQENLTMSYQDEVTDAKNITAFNDGKYFYLGKKGNSEKRFFSYCTEKEFNDFYKNTTESEIGFVDGYSKSSFVKNDSGSYTVILEDYDEETINFLNNMYGMPYEENGGKITDMVVTLTADSNFRITAIEFDYSFSDTAFSGSQTTFYSNYDSAEKILDILSPDTYTEVGDAKAISLYSHLVSQKKAKASDTFTFSSSQQKTVGNIANEESLETDIISYGMQNGSYYFTIESDVNGVKETITYRNGEYKKDGALVNDDYSDYEAKSVINGFIEPLAITYNDIANVICNSTAGSTVYTFEIDNQDLDILLTQIYQSSGATYYGSDISVEMAVKDYELVSLKCIIKARGDIKISYYSSSYSVNIETTVEFSEQVTPDL